MLDVEELTSTDDKFDLAHDLSDHLDNYTIACLIHHVMARIVVDVDGEEMSPKYRPHGAWATGGDIRLVFKSEKYQEEEQPDPEQTGRDILSELNQLRDEKEKK